ncbi:MAG: 1-phosphofructokinase family hexose kinase [Lachnospiraceae bacterium]|nr:1-phosphofructokinase family hexose kinase [Lachnospiraceae bacterium]
MIITVTMNPAVDKTAELGDFVLGGVNKLKNVIIDAGGKGINVSKTLRVLNKPNMACGFIGGPNGDTIRLALQKQMIMSDFVQVANGETRSNLKVKSIFGMTEFDEPGPKVTPEELQQLMEKLKKHAKPGTMFVLSGSLPEGVPTDIYKTMTDVLHQCGCKVFLDAGGEALKYGLEAQPEYIKPNLGELRDLYNYRDDFESNEAMVAWTKEKAVELLSKGPRMVAVSLGANGGVFTDGIETIYAPAKKVDVISPVGAGDAMTAAIAYCLDSNMHVHDVIRYAIAVSCGACTTDGTKPPSKEVIVSLLRQ